MVHALRIRVSLSTLPLVVALLGTMAPVHAQGRAEVTVQENLRAEPNGVVIAVLEPGASLEVVQDQGNWLEVILEGWVWLQSLRARDGGSFDLQVGTAGGENIRSGPQGEVLGRLEEGALLVEVERRPGWARVRRQAWIWKASVGPVSGRAAQPPASAAPAPSGLPGAFRAGSASPLLASPDGDTLTILRPGTELPVTARQGNWARVRMEGWVWMPGGAAAEAGSTEGSLSLTLAEVVGDPEASVGRLVTWDLQFVSLEEAEAVRTDFYEGEPFLLTRPLGDESARFVYVAIPPEQITAARGLSPLERVTVVGRIRTGASSLTGAPIVDLVELRRQR